MTLGSGGGGSHQNDAVGTDGTLGGGVVIIRANAFAGNGMISAKQRCMSDDECKRLLSDDTATCIGTARYEGRGYEPPLPPDPGGQDGDSSTDGSGSQKDGGTDQGWRRFIR
ncbi:hypothetical protein [Pajaroellobacter abortibovis]|uniref:Uncharacterized protein n=1 Tax=Pajaroellobacter abortibovis TaxID=1882918 RepID=A0A1L6MXT5_9BACT|nr:hypothetical protein [Pajaroellobacter abortibovis]APS00344.1 hypothetical protein BCY86_06375 [Pajaroellobacter abortibovis]